jgi:hypothetical protein
LNPLEEFVKDNWRVTHAPQQTIEHDEGNGKDHQELSDILNIAKQALHGGESIGKSLLHSITHKGDSSSAGATPTADQLSLGKLLHEHSMGAVFRDITKDLKEG